jgi:pimeloyl-ACP methyl ester carboxylesterase
MRILVLAALLVVVSSHGAYADEFMPELRRPPEPKPASLSPVFSGSKDEWPKRRSELRKAWEQIIGPLPSERVPLKPEELSRETLDGYTRILVRYHTDADFSNDAYILVPADGKPTHPGMVVLHPTTPRTINDPVGMSGRESVHNALHLVKRGYVCVVPRNYLWTFPGKDYKQAADAILARMPWKTGMAKMTWDAIRATDLLLELPGLGVDPERIGTIGHSLGGKEALYHAAFDERIKAAVSCEGGVSVRFSNWDAPWYLGSQVKSPEFGNHDHQELIALIAPRALLVIGGESADGAKSWPYIAANLGVWKLFDATDRLGLLRHTHGHDFPLPGEERERVYRWLDRWLQEGRRP